MKVRMADVAKKLGISKAAVSLAINNKPGVSEETRCRVLNCMEQLQQKCNSIYEERIPEKVIRIELITHKEEIGPVIEMDLGSEVLTAFEEEARKLNYNISFTTVYEDYESREKCIEECNMDVVEGVILFGTDMRAADRDFLKRINKPMVIYDYIVPEGDYSCVVIDARRTLELAVDELIKSGVTKTAYLATTKDVFNFNERRREFMNVMFDRGIPVEKSDIFPIGSNIAEIIGSAEEFLKANNTYDGLILENYQVSAGVIKAIDRIGIDKMRDIKMVGIDEIPKTFEGELGLTQIKIPHKDRAVITMQLLKKEIDGDANTKMRIYAVPTLLKGKTT